jgi:hypothetical protein
MIVFYYVGLLVSLVGWIWIVVQAFKTHVGWGIASLLIPLVSLIFALTHLNVAKKPLLVSVVGWVLCGIGFSAMFSQVRDMQRQVEMEMQKEMERQQQANPSPP